MSYPRLTASILAVAIVALDIAAAAQAQPQSPALPAQTPSPICVRRHATVSLTDNEADDVLQRVSAILSEQTNAPTCRTLSLVRQGPVESYTNRYPETLGSESDFKRFTSDSCVKVVTRISWCGDGLLLRPVLGCSPVPGKGIVAVREIVGVPEIDDAFNKGVEPVTWLHEFGHTRGLAHDASVTNGLMAPGINPETRVLLETQCGVLANTAFANAAVPQAGTAMPAELSVKPDATIAGGQPVPVEEFIKQPRTTKELIDRAPAYKSETAKLGAMLSDPAYAPYQTNIAALLAIIGTPQNIDPLAKLIHSQTPSATTQSDVYARLAAPLAIGSIARRFELPEKDVRVLKDASSEDFWRQRLSKVEGPATAAPTGSKPLAPAEVDRAARDLALQAYRGYALSGSTEVRQNLERDRNDLTKKGAAIPEPVLRQERSRIDEALTINKKSQTDGALSIFSAH